MSDGDSSILRTKLFRPSPAPDAIDRPHLIDLLDRGLAGRLTLVCAPAGFGKSTLVSQWIDHLEGDCRCGWFEVDKHDDDLCQFFTYFAQAIRDAYPGACRSSLELARSGTLPELKEVIRVVSNDLLELEEKLVLAIDDVHRLHGEEVFAFLGALLERPSPKFHLVLMTRCDPGLPLSKMRASGLVNEIRIADLAFSHDEACRFLAGVVEGDLVDEDVISLNERMEGWPVAYRMLAYSWRGASLDEISDNLPAIPLHARAFLEDEILARESPDRQTVLVTLSVVERFCPELCEVLCPGLDGRAFVDSLAEAGLFVVPLDGRRKWIRFHHLMQSVLRRVLGARFMDREIREAQIRAARWFSEQGYFGEALDLFLAGGDSVAAGWLVADRIRSEAVDTEEVIRRKWLERVGAEVVESNPALLLQRAWVHYHHRDHNEREEDLERVERLLEAQDWDSDDLGHWRGELLLHRMGPAIRERDYRRLARLTSEALDLFAEKGTKYRAYSYMCRVIALTSLDEFSKAYRTLEEARFEFRENPANMSRMINAECNLSMRLGDFNRLHRDTHAYVAFCRENGLASAHLVAREQAGYAAYQLNKLEDALELSRIEGVEAQIEATTTVARTYCTRAMALHALGRTGEASETMTRLIEIGRIHARPLADRWAEAKFAFFALREGRVSEAASWATGYQPERYSSHTYNLGPSALCAQILIAQDSELDRARAAEIIKAILADAERDRDLPPKIEALAIRALWHQAGGEEEKALSDLGTAIQLARPGGMIRVFADLGAKLLPLLGKLKLDEEGVAYVGRIVRAAGGLAGRADASSSVTDVPRPPAGSLVEALSKREYEILGHLAKRLSNKEIAEMLFISPVTVKRHLSNIYEKLGVHGRKETVAKAVGLGLLPR